MPQSTSRSISCCHQNPSAHFQIGTLAHAVGQGRLGVARRASAAARAALSRGLAMAAPPPVRGLGVAMHVRGLGVLRGGGATELAQTRRRQHMGRGRTHDVWPWERHVSHSCSQCSIKAILRRFFISWKKGLTNLCDMSKAQPAEPTLDGRGATKACNACHADRNSFLLEMVCDKFQSAIACNQAQVGRWWPCTLLLRAMRTCTSRRQAPRSAAPAAERLEKGHLLAPALHSISKGEAPGSRRPRVAGRTLTSIPTTDSDCRFQGVARQRWLMLVQAAYESRQNPTSDKISATIFFLGRNDHCRLAATFSSF